MISKHSLLRIAACLSVLVVASPALASMTVDLHVDSAPNVYGSPDWAGWWSNAKVDVAAGTFTNLRTGTYPGTTTIDPYDEIVYSTGDLGKRLHWIYWVPDADIVDLEAKDFEVKWVVDWGGNAWTYEGGGWAQDGAEVGWSTPSSWEEYGGGVIGSLGFAWWATDNDAPPPDTYGSPYDETDQADIDALRNTVLAMQTYATGMVRYKDSSGDWQVSSLQVQMVPAPGAAMLVFLGIGLVGWAKRRLA